MSTLFRRSAFAGALSLTFPLSGFAQSPTEPADPVDVETITVTADPFSRTADKLTQPTEILADEELDRRRGATLGETLEHELGVASSDFGRGAGRPVIRGQAGPRVLMLENGLASMDASDVSADHDVAIDPAQAQQIEILKGPATLLYGSNASAGVINVVTDKLPQRVRPGLQGRLGGSYGSNGDDGRASASLGWGIGNYQFGLVGAYADADDYDGDGGDVVPNSAVEKQSGAVSAARIGERGSLAASYGRYETTYGLPVEETAFIDLEQDRFDLEARLQDPVPGWEALRLRVAVGDYEHTEFEAPGEPGTVFSNEQTEGRLELVHAPFAGFSGVLGVQRRDREFQAIGEEAFVPSTDSRALGLFLVEQRDTVFGSVELGLRSDRDRVEPQDDALRAREFRPVSASAGLLVELNERYHVKLYGTRAQRSPVTEELYAYGPHLATGSFERGRDDFGLETAHNLELSLDRHGGPLNWRVNLYGQRISSYVFQREVDAGLDADGQGVAASDGVADRVDEEGAFAPDGELLLLDYAAADARFWGVEAEASRLWALGGTELTARLFGDLARGRLRDGGDLPRITPARVGLGLHAHRGPWNATLDLTRVLRQERIASLESETDGYSLLAADLEYAWVLPTGTVAFYLRGRNLLDDEARRHTSFIKEVAPLPGASLVGGLEWRFD